MNTQELSESKSVFEHIGDLRKKLLIALFAFIIGAIISHIYNAEIIAFLLKPAGGQHLIFLSPLEPFLFIFKIDCIGGILLSFPIIIWCLLSFISPALSKKINKLVIFFLITSSVLLILGLIYAFFVTIPITLKFLFSINVVGIENNFSVEKYLSFFITQAFIIMIVFQVPILIIGGIYLGILKTRFLAKKRRIIYMILLVALAVITPTADVFSLAIIFIPCLVIFEISLLGGKIIERLKRKNKELIILENSTEN